jgi:hypothetical protein
VSESLNISSDLALSGYIYLGAYIRRHRFWHLLLVIVVAVFIIYKTQHCVAPRLFCVYAKVAQLLFHYTISGKWSKRRQAPRASRSPSSELPHLSLQTNPHPHPHPPTSHAPYNTRPSPYLHPRQLANPTYHHGGHVCRSARDARILLQHSTYSSIRTSTALLLPVCHCCKLHLNTR